jgi:uncharacterized Zn finger protein
MIASVVAIGKWKIGTAIPCKTARMEPRIANVLRGGALAAIVGTQTWERGEQVFASGRVDKVEIEGGEIKGVIKSGGAPYIVRISMHAEGIAYECTCPIGQRRVFCKHTVAIALHHLEAQRKEAEAGMGVLQQALSAIPHEVLIEGLINLARKDREWSDELKRLCLHALERGRTRDL